MSKWNLLWKLAFYILLAIYLVGFFKHNRLIRSFISIIIVLFIHQIFMMVSKLKLVFDFIMNMKLISKIIGNFNVSDNYLFTILHKSDTFYLSTFFSLPWNIPLRRLMHKPLQSKSNSKSLPDLPRVLKQQCFHKILSSAQFQL